MRWGCFLLGVWVGVLMVPAIDSLHPMREGQAYRSWTGLVPFSDVTVDRADVSDGVLSVAGAMIKRRCEFVSLSAYVQRGGRWERAWVDTAGEDSARPGGNRPPGSQAWGAWAIRIVPPDPVPDHWRIWAHHRCPEDDGAVQSNIFAEGPWPR